jgi:hypothetical protein
MILRAKGCCYYSISIFATIETKFNFMERIVDTLQNVMFYLASQFVSAAPPTHQQKQRSKRHMIVAVSFYLSLSFGRIHTFQRFQPYWPIVRPGRDDSLQSNGTFIFPLAAYSASVAWFQAYDKMGNHPVSPIHLSKNSYVVRV